MVRTNKRFTRRSLIKLAIVGGSTFLTSRAARPRALAAGTADMKKPGERWYEEAFYLLHLDHHTTDQFAVGSEADPAETDRLIALSRPDVIQIHAKGAPGWTTYPTKIGHTPRRLARDVLAVWRDIARRRGYAWSIYYNFGRDGEIMKRRPEWNRVDAKGKPRDKMLCYHSGVAEEYLWPMIDEEMARYEPDAFWFDGSCFTVQTCYCAKCRERFKRQTGLDMPRTPQEKGWDEFKEMHRQIYRETVSATAARIKQHNPCCRVAFNWAYGLHLPEDPPAGVDHLTGDTGNAVDLLSMEAHWYDAQPRPFDLMTTVFYNDGRRTSPKPQPQMEQEMAIIIANGGRYHAWDNPTQQSGLVAERQEFLGRVVAPFLRVRQRWCLGTKRLPVVSLLFTSTHHYAATRNSPVCYISAAHASLALRGASDALQRAHLDYEIISRERLLRREIATCCLLAEDLAAAKPDEVAALRGFVEKGGTLVLTGGGAKLAGLDSLAGVRSVEPTPITQPWQVRLKTEALSSAAPLWKAAPLKEVGAEVLLTAETAGRQQPLVIRRVVEDGQVIAILCPLFSLPSPSAGPLPELDPLRAWLLDMIAPVSFRLLTTDAPKTVEMVLRRKGNERVLHLVNRARGNRERFAARYIHWRITDIPPVPACRVSLRVATRPRGVFLQPQNRKLDSWEFCDGILQLQVPEFLIHQIVVVQS